MAVTAAGLLVGLAAPIALAPLLLGAAAYVPGVAAAGGLMWGVGKAKE